MRCYHLDMFVSMGPELAAAWPGSCGPGCLGSVIPDGPFGGACRFHDFAYLVGGTKADFLAVERAFRSWLFTAARASNRPWLWLPMALTYAAWTRTWGWHLRRWRRDDKPMTRRELRATKEYRDAQSKV